MVVSNQSLSSPGTMHSGGYDVVVIGAGPVGMVLGCLLGQGGMRVLLLDRRLRLPEHSQAIGITPPSLKILSRIGLADAFINQGVRIRDCHVHGHSGYLGCASFRKIPGPWPFVLSLPQRISMRLLEEKLAAHATVELRLGVEVNAISQDDAGVTVAATTADGSSLRFTAAYAAACDGCHSPARNLLNAPGALHHYGCHFVMGDFLDQSLLGSDAHLFFTASGAVESFPLPEGRRRWIVQTHQRLNEAPSALISTTVRERTGLQLNPEDQLNQTSFSPWRLDAARLHFGRVILCGDAAHVMSPIGGQGMNTGIADAEYAAAMLRAIIQGGHAPAPWLADYERCRRIAARTAAGRAAHGMGLGTWCGVAASLLRDVILRFFILRGPMADRVGPWFSMMSIPCNGLEKCAWAMAQLHPGLALHPAETSPGRPS